MRGRHGLIGAGSAALFLLAGAAWGQGRWQPITPPMPTPRDAHTVVLIGQKALLIGGRTRASGATTAEVAFYDMASGAFAPAAAMATSRSFVPAVLLDSGDVLLPGGFRQINGDETIR